MTQRRGPRQGVRTGSGSELSPITQTIGPAVILTVATMLLYSIRGEVLGTERYFHWVPQNLVLAWIPYGLAAFAAALAGLLPRHRWTVLPVALAWLLFFPNAPYVVSDVMNVRKYPVSIPWYDMLLVTTLALTGLVLALASLRTFQRLVSARWGRTAGVVFAIAVIYLSAVGVWIGRFLRWNSWDAFRHATDILRGVPLYNNGVAVPRLLLFAIAFGTVQACVYWAYAAGRRD